MATDLYLREDIAAFLGERDPFATFATMDGEVFRALESRRTYAVLIQDRRFFIKYHRGTPVGEILKNLIRGRLPVTSARNEWRAIQALNELGVSVPVIAGYGCRGAWPHAQESFIVTEDVGTQRNLEDLTRGWPTAPPAFRHKQALLENVADISRTLHRHGICHRDFYLCHFMLLSADPPALTLIDLHRALIKASLDQRWVIKDVGSLYFSAMKIGLTRNDLFRFVRRYSGTSLRQTLTEKADFWRAVRDRADRLFQRHG